MKGAVQILLLCVLIPMAGMAQTESMEERKKRIMRKYLREAGTLTESDWVVPDDSEDEAVIDSERFKEPDVEFERHQAPTIPPPRFRRPAAQDRSDNWLLDDEAEDSLSEDPYADPFALRDEDVDSERDRSRQRRWDDVQYDRQDPRDERDSTDLFSRRDRYKSRLDTDRDARTFLEDPEDRRLPGRQYGTGSEDGLFGRRPREDDSSPSQLLPKRTYGTSPDNGLLYPTPYSTTPSYGRDAEKEDRLKKGQIPFRGYRRPEPETQDKWGSQEPQSPTRSRYTQPLPYQQLKDREKAWDPTADDAYMDELKRKTHLR